MSPKVFYHDDIDGTVAAWLYGKILPANAQYQPFRHGDPFPSPAELSGFKPVVLLDFTPPLSYLKQYDAELGDDILLIDHHKVERPEVRGFRWCHIDGVSATRMVYDFLQKNPDLQMALLRLGPAMMAGTRRLVDLVNQIDLGTESDEATYACAMFEATVCGAVGILPKFRILDQVALNLGASVHGSLFMGQQIHKWKSSEVARLMDRAYEVTWRGVTVPVVNAPSCTKMALDYLEISGTAPFAVAWWFDGRVYEVRLRAMQDTDVSEIAREYGGGGHARAAGFRIDKLPWETGQWEEH